LLYITAVQKVELVGGGSWWHRNSGSLVLAIAAISAAIVAAYVAIHNQRQQLAHDRFLRNQDHIRDTLDKALLIGNEARDAMDNFMAGVQTLEAKRREEVEIPESTEEIVEKYEETTITRLHAMRGAQVRLETRLGKDDPVAVSHKAAFAALHTLLREGHDGVSGLREDEVSELDSAREKDAAMAFSSFQTACHDWLKNSAA